MMRAVLAGGLMGQAWTMAAPETPPSPPPIASPPAVAGKDAPAAGPPVPAACRGDHIDLAQALTAAACELPAGVNPEPLPREDLVLVIEPEDAVRIKPGGLVELRVSFRNRSPRALTLVFQVPAGGDGLGLGLGRRTSAEAAVAPGFVIKASNFLGQSVDTPTDEQESVFGDGADPRPHGILGVSFPPRRIRLVIDAGGEASGRLVWKAVGYVPYKKYRAQKVGAFVTEPAPEPLPPGAYRIWIHAPLQNAAPAARATLTVNITGKRSR
jgi:hypothetical protein